MAGLLLSSGRFSAPFNPVTTFSKGFFLADDLSALADGANVTSWTDEAAFLNFGYDPDWGIGTVPIFKTNIVNGHPVVRFTPANAALRRDPPAPIPQPFTVAMVLKVGNAASGNIIWVSGGGAVQIYLAGATQMRIQAGSPALATVPDLTVGFHYLLAIFDGASSVLRVDGANRALDVSPGTNSVAQPSFLNHHSVGANCDLPLYGLAPSHLSAGEITSAESYMAARYGL